MRIRTPAITSVLTLLLLLQAARPAHAQLVRGFVSGTVTDTSDAILAGVQVTLTNKATNISRGIPTNDSGFYRFVAVEPGDYTISFQLMGFASRRVEDMTVKTAQEVVVHQILAPAGGATEVTVMGAPGAELLKTTPTVERTLTDRVVAELPMQIFNGVRDISRLALLAPTVARVSSFTEFSANGQRSRNNNFIIDGADNNDLSVTLNSLRVIPEAVVEVQIQTSSYSAEFGNRSGAQISAITKSGTNLFRGEAWEYYRGNWMEPLSLPNKRGKITETPRFVLNQFGADLGGPVFKDRTFFFGLLEANRRREAPAATNAAAITIPTPLGYAALASVPLGPGQTAAARESVLSALSFLPQIHTEVGNYQTTQNGTINGVPIQTGTILIPLARPSNFWYSVARIDHRLSNNDSFTYRYHFDRSDQPNFTGNNQFGPRFTATQAIRRQNHAASYTRIFSDRFLNEARLAYTRGRLFFPENDPVSSTVNITNFFTFGGLAGFPQDRLEQAYQFQNVATYIAGRNSIKFGLDVRRNRIFSRFALNSKGTWTFANLESFLNNQPFSVTQAANDPAFNAGQWNQSYFFQDDVKITKDFTLNLGLRYEYSTVPLGFFGATDPAVLAIGIPGPAQTDRNNWAPRIGFAYSPDARTSLRGGFGVGYDILFYGILVNAANNYPRVQTSLRTDPAVISNLFPRLPEKVATTVLDPITTAFVSIPENSQSPTTHFWNLSLQRELHPDYLIEFGYTGNRSYHQLRQRDRNPGVLTAAQAATVIATGVPNQVSVQRLNPSWGARNQIEPAAKGEYHAGYVKFDKRMSRNLLIGANYTWSAAFSDSDEAFGLNDIINSSPQVPQDFFDYSNEWSRSAFDRPHRLAVHYIYDIPAPAAAGVLGHILGGWGISGMTELQSGQPFTIRTGADTVGTLAGALPGRPNFRRNGIMLKDPDTDDLRTFTVPANDTGIVVAPRHPVSGAILANSMPGGGNLGRNTFRGPSFQNWNVSVMKRIPITENVNVQLRSDFVNAWNHNNFQNPVAAMANPNFGQNTATLLTDARQILLSAKLKF